MNKISIRLSLITLGTILPLSVAWAAPTFPTPTPAPPAVSSSDSSRHLNNLKTHGVAEADRRLAMFQVVSVRLASSTQLTAADKSALTNQIDAQVAILGALKTKLATESNLIAARKDIQSIIDEYRVYGLIVAQMSLVTSADRMAESQTQLQAVITKLQKRTNSLKRAGKDTAYLQKALDLDRATIASAQALFSQSTAQALAFKATDYSSDHKVLSGYRDKMTTARDNFRTVRSSIDILIADIDKLK